MASSAGVGTTTSGSTAAQGASSAGSRVGGSTANVAPSSAPAQPNSGVQQGGKGVSGRQVAEGVTRGLGLMSAMAVPGMESAAGLSLGAGQPQPTPNSGGDDAPSMAPSSNNEPENVIRPADPVPSSDNGPKPGTKGED